MSAYIVCRDCKLHRSRAAGIPEGEGWTELPRGVIHDSETHWVYPDLAAYRADIGVANGSVLKPSAAA